MKHTYVHVTLTSVAGQLKKAHTTVERIVCEYDDGRVQVASGDVWQVKEVDGKLVTVR